MISSLFVVQFPFVFEFLKSCSQITLFYVIIYNLIRDFFIDIFREQQQQFINMFYTSK